MKFVVGPELRRYEDGSLNWADLDFLKSYGFELSDYSIYTYPPQKELFIAQPLPDQTMRRLVQLVEQKGFWISSV